MDETLAPGIPPIPDGTLIRRMEMNIASVTAEGAEGSMPVEGNRQVYGLLHGGASAALAETLGSLAAMAHAAPDGVAVGVDLSITHHKAVTDGRITGVATALHRGRTVASYAIDITDDAGARVSTARLTCAIRPKPASG
jgi:uncharacterized protein (TIGR00369 family)